MSAVEAKEKDPHKQMRSSLSSFLTLSALFTVAVNLLLLVSPLFMIQVYDRVMTSGSVPTLLSVGLIAVFLLGIYAMAEAGRRHILSMFSGQLSNAFAPIIAMIALKKRSRSAAVDDKFPTVADVTRLRGFLGSGGLLPVMDLPFAPLFLGLMFLLHPVIGLLGLIGAASLIGLAFLTEKMTSKRFVENQKAEMAAQNHLTGMLRSRNAILSQGMSGRLGDRWEQMFIQSTDSAISTSVVSGLLTGITRGFRQVLQIMVLGLGAYLALQHELSSGAIVAGSIVMGRALGPIDQIVASWRQLSLARSSWKKLADADFHSSGITEPFTPTLIERADLYCESVSIAPIGREEPLFQQFSMRIQPGSIFALVGSSGAGKSTLLQTLAGVVPPMSGKVFLGGRDMFEWPDEDLGRNIGYLPQHVELIPGTIVENISRFNPGQEMAAQETAKRIGIFDLVMSIPGAFDAEIRPDNAGMSAGQRQAVGLGRAFFGKPQIIILDEPTANLDPEMVVTMLQTFKNARDEGAILVIATHDQRVFAVANEILQISNGRIARVERQADANRPRAVT